MQFKTIQKPLSIYIHIPFCRRKCNYCDFLSFAINSPLRGEGVNPITDKVVDKYVNALCFEIASACYCKLEQQSETPCFTWDDIHSVFIGGGTPSLLTNKQISKIFDALGKTFNIQPGIEITIEANPNSVTREKLQHWRSLGINRISIGVQSFDDAVLKTLGRVHDAEQAVQAVKLASEYFENINIDLIHSVSDSKPVLNHRFPAALGMITHVSAYSLIIEPGTPFALTHKPLDEAQSIRQQKQIEQLLKNHNFEQYEVSNFAKVGSDADYRCRHNLAYWQPHTHEYIGFGLGAHSLFGNKRFSNTKDLKKYMAKHCSAKTEKTSRQNTFNGGEKTLCRLLTRTNTDIATEIVMLGLRTTGGVVFRDLLDFGFDIQTQKRNEIAELVKGKFIKVASGRLACTRKGFLVLNQIINKLTP